MKAEPTPGLLTDYDLHLFNEGTFFGSYEKMGAQLARRDGVAETNFGVLEKSD